MTERHETPFPTGGTVYPLDWRARATCDHSKVIDYAVRWNAAGSAQVYRNVCIVCGYPVGGSTVFAPYAEAIAAGSAITVLAPRPADYYATKPAYADYITSREWYDGPRQACYEYWEGRCAICNQPGTEVHHRTYARLGAEQPTDIVLLCTRCHRLYENAKDAE